MQTLLAGVVAGCLTLSLGAQVWNRAEAYPGERAFHVMTHDRARDRVVLFGHPLGDNVTWEWDGAAWSPNHTASYPNVTTHHAMVYDDVRRVTWLFDFVSRQTWSYDGRGWTQHAVPLAPPYREAATMVFDRQRGVAVLFGGLLDHHSVRGDTWEWDGSSWTQRQPPVVPPARAGQAMVYDPAAGHVLMFGGSTLSGLLDDTWTWDGTFWVQQQTFVRPSARWHSAMGFDPIGQRALLFGGQSLAGGHDDTWQWTGTAWQQLQPATTPPASATHAMATHDATASVVMQGPGVGETWRWDGSDWAVAQKWPAPALAESAAATDRARGRIVVFGGPLGGSTASPQVPTGTWEWDGLRWQRRQPAVEPPPRGRGCMAHDPILGRTILFGGRTSVSQAMFDTWYWDGSQWAQQFPPSTPAISTRATMYFDGALGRALLVSDASSGSFGGYFEFAWTGTDWQALPPSNIGAFHAACFDEARGVTVAVTSLGTFERGTVGTWQQRAANTPFPGNFEGKGFAYDPSLQRCVWVAYTTGLMGWSAPAWSWDGAAWSSLTPVEGYGYYAPRLLVEDPTRGQLSLIGGSPYATRFWNLTTTPASAATFGSSCGGSTGEVTVTARGRPRTGNAEFGIDVDHALPGALVLLGVSIGEGNTPLGSGCTWYFGGPITSHLLLANAAGFAAQPLPIPASVVFRGLPLASQAFALDPAGPHLGALAASAGLRLLVGD